MKQKPANQGFTLVELMFVVAILAVLSLVAVFSYRAYLRKARTQEGIAFLMDIKMKQDTYFMTYSRYVSTTTSPDDYYPPIVSTPAEWSYGGTVWNCDAPPNQAIAGLCALGIMPTAEMTWFQYLTIGWEPGASTPDPQFIRDPTRRWWFARAKGFAGSDGRSLPFELRMTSEVNEVMELTQ